MAPNGSFSTLAAYVASQARNKGAYGRHVGRLEKVVSSKDLQRHVPLAASINGRLSTRT